MSAMADGEGRAARRAPRACTLRHQTSRPTPTPSTLTLPSPSSSPLPSVDGDVDPSHVALAPPPSQEQRLKLRSMWELASVINFMNVFRPVLHFTYEFSIEELETSLMSPNSLLDRVHIDLLKAIPPISKTLLTSDTWVTALCKKMKDWWCWVAEGSFPLVPHHGEENAKYKSLSLDVRVCILKALCEVRLDQEDIRNYVDEVLKKGSLSVIRKEAIGNVMQMTTYWYENDPMAGQRLYREFQGSPKSEKVSKLRGRLVPPPTCQWETLATNLDEFETLVENLCSSRNKMEAGVGDKIVSDIIPELKELQKKRERAVKKQQRQAQLLDSSFIVEGIAAGRPRRDRKPVTYTFDDYDKSINEAIKYNNMRLSPDSIEESEERQEMHTNSSAGPGDVSKFEEAHSLPEPCNDIADDNDHGLESYDAHMASSDEENGYDKQFNSRKRKINPEFRSESHGDLSESDIVNVSKVETLPTYQNNSEALQNVKEESDCDIQINEQLPCDIKMKEESCDTNPGNNVHQYLDLKVDSVGLSFSDSCRSPHLVPKLDKCSDDLSSY